MYAHYTTSNNNLPAKTTWTTHAVHPFCPLGIEPPIRLFVFWLEHPNGHTLPVLHKVAPAWALKFNGTLEKDYKKTFQAVFLLNEFVLSNLVYSLRKDAIVDGQLCLSDQLRELRIIWEISGWNRMFILSWHHHCHHFGISRQFCREKSQYPIYCTARCSSHPIVSQSVQHYILAMLNSGRFSWPGHPS